MISHRQDSPFLTKRNSVVIYSQQPSLRKSYNPTPTPQYPFNSVQRKESAPRNSYNPNQNSNPNRTSVKSDFNIAINEPKKKSMSVDKVFHQIEDKGAPKTDVYFKNLKQKYLSQYMKIDQRIQSISKSDKENIQYILKCQEQSPNVSVIPLVHKNSFSQQQNSQQITPFFKSFLSEALPLIQICKNLIETQWILYSKYEPSIKELIFEIWNQQNKQQSKEQSNILMAMQTINTIMSLLSYLDHKMDEKNLPKLVDLNVKEKFTRDRAIQLISNIFLSPGFFMKKRSNQSRVFDLVEMRQQMKNAIDYQLQSEILFLNFIGHYSREEITSQNVFKQLKSNEQGNYLTPQDVIKTLATHLKITQMKPDHCFHFLYHFNKKNCLQITSDQFTALFRK